MSGPPRQAPRSFEVIKFFAFLGFLLVLYLLLFPSLPYCGPSPEQILAKNDLLEILAAIKQYYAEYGTYPPVTPDGRIVTAEQNAHLMRILRGPESNPRKIVFLEIREPSWKGPLFHKKLDSGLDPATGAYLDPWGNFYRIVYAITEKAQIQSPYEDERDTPIRAMLIAWSFGRDGVQSPAHKIDGRIADDIISWQ